MTLLIDSLHSGGCSSHKLWLSISSLTIVYTSVLQKDEEIVIVCDTGYTRASMLDPLITTISKNKISSIIVSWFMVYHMGHVD